MRKEILKLKKAGYSVTKFTQFHYGINRSGTRDTVNWWPTARKVLRKYKPGPAAKYSDLLKAVAGEFEGSKNASHRTIFVIGEMWDEDDPLVKQVLEYRRDPLGYIKRLIENRAVKL